MIEALLHCGCLKSPDKRNAVINDLPQYIQNKIARDLNPKFEITSILNTCLQFSDGLNSLLEVIEFFESNKSKSWQSLERIIEQIAAAASVTEGIDALAKTLSSR